MIELKDRVPTKPNRKLITPENGSSPYYATVINADEPVETGTPINKSVLKQIGISEYSYSKSENTHILTGSGNNIKFIPTSDFVTGDIITVNGTTVTPVDNMGEAQDEPFKANIVQNATLQGDKLVFKLGGGIYGTLPPQIKQFTAKAGNHEITLNWTNPDDPNFAGLYIVRKQGSMPTKLSDGVKIDVGTATSYTDTEPENDLEYYYRAFTYNAKKQIQTELTGAVVSATPKAFSLPKYTGQHAIFGNEEKGRIEMYSSGTLTLDEASYDLFAVGGGASISGYSPTNALNACGGGGGGFTATKKHVKISKTSLSVDIASIGAKTTIGDIVITDKITNGGQNHNGTPIGSSGGSGGGGGYGGNGGSNGSDGDNTFYIDDWGLWFGKGQGTTTRAFEESSGTLYAGGGGAGNTSGTGGSGGAGGGADGTAGYIGNNAPANTGGGGGGTKYGGGETNTGGKGGSGIAIVRWGY